MYGRRKYVARRDEVFELDFRKEQREGGVYHCDTARDVDRLRKIVSHTANRSYNGTEVRASNR